MMPNRPAEQTSEIPAFFFGFRRNIKLCTILGRRAWNQDWVRPTGKAFDDILTGLTVRLSTGDRR